MEAGHRRVVEMKDKQSTSMEEQPECSESPAGSSSHAYDEYEYEYAHQHQPPQGSESEDEFVSIRIQDAEDMEVSVQIECQEEPQIEGGVEPRGTGDLAEEEECKEDTSRAIVVWKPEDDEEQSVDEDAPYCRICFEGPMKNEPLFTTCKCSGSVAYVHHSCLSKWIADSGRVSCEICGSDFTVPKGIRPLLLHMAVLNKACNIAQESNTVSATLLSILPSQSGSVTPTSAIIYLRGYSHDAGCMEFGLCHFPQTFPSALAGVVSTSEWWDIIKKMNRVSEKMINISWRFLVFVTSLFLNVFLIIILSFVDHAVVIPFMFAVIVIQLLPALMFAWIAAHLNARVHLKMNQACSELNEEYEDRCLVFGFHAITADFRTRNRIWNPYSVHPLGEPKTLKFLIVDRGNSARTVS